MQLETMLLQYLGAKKERSRDGRENALYFLLSDSRTPRLDLDQVSAYYNRLQVEQPWDDFAEVARNCTPLWPGLWAEWTDHSLGGTRVGCALIELPDEAALEIPGIGKAEYRWRIVGHFAFILPDRTYATLPLDIVTLIDRDGRPLPARIGLPDDRRNELTAEAGVFNVASNLLLTTLLGVSWVHAGLASRDPDGRIYFALNDRQSGWSSVPGSVGTSEEGVQNPLASTWEDCIVPIPTAQRAVARDTGYHVSEDMLPALRAMYPVWIRDDLREVRIVQTPHKVCLDATTLGSWSSEESVTRVDLGFIHGGDDPMFPPHRPVEMNARNFLTDLDPYGIINTVDLFNKDGIEGAQRWYEEQKRRGDDD